MRTPIFIMGAGIDPVSTRETVALVDQMIATGRPHHLVTANVDFLVQARKDVELRRIILQADLVLCDGTPLLWCSRLFGNALPERVAGSDTVPVLIERAAQKGYRVFFLGGRPTSAAHCVARIRAQYPGLAGVETYAPPFAPLLDMNDPEIIRRVRAASPHLLLVAFGCPKQEKWIAMHLHTLGVPVVLGVGATVDFLAGTVRRAPAWMRRSGMEWIFRLLQEPRRLAGRYLRDLVIFALGVAGQMAGLQLRPGKRLLDRKVVCAQTPADCRVALPAGFDRESVREGATVWQTVLSSGRNCLLDASGVRGIDSTGLGLCTHLWRCLQRENRSLVLVAPSRAMRRALAMGRLEVLLPTAPDWEAAVRWIERRMQQQSEPVLLARDPDGPRLIWQGEITARQAEQVQRLVETRLAGASGRRVVLDLSGLSFIDSAGAALLRRTRDWVKDQGGRLQLRGLQPAVRNVLHFSGVLRETAQERES